MKIDEWDAACGAAAILNLPNYEGRDQNEDTYKWGGGGGHLLWPYGLLLCSRAYSSHLLVASPVSWAEE